MFMQSNSSDKYVHMYTCTNIEVFNLFDPELQLINTKTMIENKLKQLLSELKKVKAQTLLFLKCKKRNDGKIFSLSTKLIVNDSVIDEAFISMH